MKAGNKDIAIDTSVMPNNLIASTIKEEKAHKSIFITILPVLSMIVAILPGIFSKTSGIEIAKVGILTMILTCAAAFYIRINAEHILKKKLAKTVITIAYLGAIFLLLFVPHPENLSFWMIGGLLVAMLIDSKLGLLLYFNLSFILGISYSLPLEIVIQILIIGAIMCLLAGALRNIATFIYAIIIVLSTNITLSFVVNNFIFEANINYNYLYSLFSILAVLVTAYLLCLFYDRVGIRNSNTGAKEPDATILQIEAEKAITIQEIAIEDIAIEIEDIAIEIEDIAIKIEDNATQKEESDTIEIDAVQQKLGIRTSYEILCDTDNDLMRKMKQHSESLFAHAINIGDLSCRAAKEVGADELLAKAGGYYHEVGKLNGKNYIEEGLLIAEDYSFPQELRAILKEHNIKYEKPNSVEAAIVMLSDNVVSTIEYIEKTGDQKFTSNKIIDNIFQMRMEKGTFDAANLTLMDFKKLKGFYQNEFNSPRIAK